MRPVIRLNYAVDIIQTFSEKEPLSSHLSRYFKQYKSIGSKDRKILRNLVYHYFRLGHCQRYLPLDEGIVLGHFLCTNEKDEFLDYWLPTKTVFTEADVLKPVKQKFSILADEYSAISFENLFPFIDSLSPQVYPEKELLFWSLMEQPKVYLYHFRNQPQQLINDCQNHKIPVARLGANSFSVPPGTDLSKLETVKNGKAIVQDLSVQQCLSDAQFSENAQIWDCCAGSGGKSILVKYLKPTCFIWATDHRKTILKNLEKRFTTLGIDDYQTKVWDLAIKPPYFLKNLVQTVILDAPCSGSGTWARTPEDLYTTTGTLIKQHHERQKLLAANAANVLKKGDKIIYLTCSVFKEENEHISAYIQEELGFQLIEEVFFKGFNRMAETLFRAVLVKK